MKKLKVNEVLTRDMVREANTRLISGTIVSSATKRDGLSRRSFFRTSVAEAGRAAMARSVLAYPIFRVRAERTEQGGEDDWNR